MIIYEKLAEIQQKLKAPKDARNDFGKYNYRNVSGILEAVKPLMGVEASLLMSDTVVEVGGHLFIKSTVEFCFGGERVYSDGWALHSLTKKGMDAAQITGATSSYARKYALNGLFAIDDSEGDPDSRDNRNEQGQINNAQFEKAVETAITAINNETDFESLGVYFNGLVKKQRQIASDQRVIAAKNQAKARLEPKENDDG